MTANIDGNIMIARKLASDDEVAMVADNANAKNGTTARK